MPNQPNDHPNDLLTDQLIAERTLAVMPEAAPDRAPGGPARSRLLLAAGLLAAVVLAGMLWLGPRPPGQGAAGDLAHPGGQRAGPEGAADTGILNCNAWPTARVYLDGQHLLGTTPLSHVRLSPGAHVLLLVSKDGTQRKEVPVTLAPSETRTLAISLADR